MHSLLLKGGLVVDPKNGLRSIADVAVEDGRIAAVAPEISAPAKEVVDCTGLVVQPGLIDTHLHITITPAAYASVVAAGVTTCLDMMGPTKTALDVAGTPLACGLNVAVLNAVIPDQNVTGRDPSAAELAAFIESSVEGGAFGVKLLGGHFPLTPRATADFFRLADERNTYAAFHAGTTATGSHIEGLEEAFRLFDGHRAHLAHINAYCRGYLDTEMNECRRAADLLKAHPEVVCESYVSPRNGGSLQFLENGLPHSMVVRSTMKHLGYDVSREGAHQAFLDGMLGAVREKDGLIELVTGEDGFQWNESHPGCGISFDRVNPILPRTYFATARRDDGTFLVDGLSTDGGGLPRNVILALGLSLVKLGGLSLTDFAAKTSLIPSRMLGLANKGHLSIGADADITVFDLERQKPVASFIGGEKALWNGRPVHRPGHLITTEAGAAAVHRAGIEPLIVPGGVPTLDRRF